MTAPSKRTAFLDVVEVLAGALNQAGTSLDVALRAASPEQEPALRDVEQHLDHVAFVVQVFVGELHAAVFTETTRAGAAPPRFQ